MFLVIVPIYQLIALGILYNTSAYLSAVIDLAAVCTFLPIGWTLSGWIAATTVTAALLCGHFYTCLFISPIVSECPFTIFILSNSFVLVKLSIIAYCTIWASTVLAQPNGCSPVISALS